MLPLWRRKKLDVFLWNYRFHLLVMTRFGKTLTKCKNGCISLKQSFDDRLHDVSIGWKWYSQGYTSQNLFSRFVWSTNIACFWYSIWTNSHYFQQLIQKGTETYVGYFKCDRKTMIFICQFIIHAYQEKWLTNYCLLVGLSFGSFPECCREVACKKSLICVHHPKNWWN